MATGSTPLPIYQALAAKVGSGAVDASRARVAQLDEYVGLPAEHPEVVPFGAATEVLNRWGWAWTRSWARTAPPRTCRPRARRTTGRWPRPVASTSSCSGSAPTGTSGSTSPRSSLASRTRIKTLTEQTRVDNARFFEGDIEQVPHHVITQGIGTILEARHLVLLATGEGKADAVAATVEGPVAAVCPASALQLHPHATVVVDEAAASKLKLADYFRHTFANKPDCRGVANPRGEEAPARRSAGPLVCILLVLRAPPRGPSLPRDDLRRRRPHTLAAPCVAMWRAPRSGAWGRPSRPRSCRGRSSTACPGRPPSRVAISSRTTATTRRTPAAARAAVAAPTAKLPVSVPGSSLASFRGHAQGVRPRRRCSPRGEGSDGAAPRPAGSYDGARVTASARRAATSPASAGSRSAAGGAAEAAAVQPASAHPLRRVREALLGEFTGAHRRDKGVAQAPYRLVVREPAAHADRVRAGRDGEDAARSMPYVPAMACISMPSVTMRPS